MQLMKLKIKIKTCKVCFKEIHNFNMVSFLKPNYEICNDCLISLSTSFEKTKINKCKTLILYEYNEFLKTCLYKLKGAGDIEIASIFLSGFYFYLKIKYYKYSLVLVPSYLKREEERGFNHLEEIFKILKMEILKPLIKISDRKQTNLNETERQKISNYIIWDSNCHIKNKKILLVDDVITSGATINACLNLIKKENPKKIKILIISRAT